MYLSAQYISTSTHLPTIYQSMIINFDWKVFHSFISFLCDLGYHGLYCEEEYNECLSTPCQNGATCRDLENGYKCLCLAEYEGKMALISCFLNVPCIILL